MAHAGRCTIPQMRCTEGCGDNRCPEPHVLHRIIAVPAHPHAGVLGPIIAEFPRPVNETLTLIVRTGIMAGLAKERSAPVAGELNLRVVLARPTVPVLPTEQLVYALVELRPVSGSVTTTLPLNLSLVLDRS